MYKYIKTLLFKFNPETIHYLVFKILHYALYPNLVQKLFKKINLTNTPSLKSNLFNLDFPTPFGLAAGFDKNAEAPYAWPVLGFGFSEIGTVTPKPQPGNPKPRLFRLIPDESLLNRMGFNNAGAEKVVENLSKYLKFKSSPIGINIGKNKITPLTKATADYGKCAATFNNLADFFIINISSPNTPDLRKLQNDSDLSKIITTVQKETSKPILVKLSPDLSLAELNSLVNQCIKLEIAGIVATNTTISRENLASPHVDELGPGGISGPVLADKSIKFLRAIYEQTKNTSLKIISVGGVSTPAEVWERITLGANLVEGYTGFIYQGPFWAYKVNKYLKNKLLSEKIDTISDAVGIAYQK